MASHVHVVPSVAVDLLPMMTDSCKQQLARCIRDDTAGMRR